MEKIIDIYNREYRYEKRLQKFKRRKINGNKQMILDFLRDCELGKTVKKRGKKKISVSTRLKSLIYLERISGWLKKPFTKITQKEFEEFILNLERGKYKRYVDNKPFTERTKAGYKEIIRKFFDWANQTGKTKLDISFIDTTSKDPEIPAISLKDMEKMIGRAHDIRTKFILRVLFDSGARIEEFLNIIWHDITWDEESKCYMLRIRVSKTKPRTISLPLSTKEINDYMEDFKEKGEFNPERPVVNMSYDAVRMLIGRLSEKVLGKRLSPHDFRHASATYYANKLNYFPFCYRYGWTFSSPQPQRYIDRSGIREKETVKIIQADVIGKYEKENKTLREDMSRLITENKEIWKWLEKLAVINKITQEAVTKNKKVEVEFKKAAKRLLASSEFAYPTTESI